MTPAGRRPALHALPDDVLLLVISHVDVPDILSLRAVRPARTSRRFCAMSKLRWVWYDAIQRHVVQKGLPIPAATTDLKALTSEHLEARTVHASRFHANWNAPRPVTRAAIEFCAESSRDPDADGPHAVSHVAFLPGHNGQYLLTTVGKTLAAWEIPLGSSEAYCVAEWVSTRKIEGMVVNDDPKGEVTVAIVSAHPTAEGVVECRSLSFDKFRGRFYCRMELRARREVVSPLHYLHDDYLVFGDPMHVCFLGAPTHVKPLGNAALSEMTDNRVLAVKVINRYLLVIRQRAFEVLFAPTWKGMRASYPSLVSASVSIEMDISASNATIVFRQSPYDASEDQPDWPSEPVTVLSRYSDDGFDTLHQYDFLPNPMAKRTELEKGAPPTTMEYIPCIFPSRSTTIVSVAPSSCDFRVGPSGKGFWTETRNITLRHARTPARCLVGFTVRPATPRDRDPKACKARRVARLELCKDALYWRRCNIHEILWKKYMMVSTAFEDTVGRIAIGDAMGRVEVLDLA
ncbi:uncharacterized protein BXZ73DRAFT_40976 [Epithele typhae]|uniref:uncharacterized protein n=1 Tax=Epithele typhae TaxID=378194 RepID=UPI0020089D0C|nr:uncharacterized protein BXZ73DRAFT_40976 [Epithele typhae]KAH9942407.1 hypothetical protein BXZ73DRAFT_40976 [Epithele typhae]